MFSMTLLLALVAISLGSILGVMLSVALVGFLAWLIVAVVPMPPRFSTAIYGVAAVVALLILLRWLSVPMAI